MKCFVFIPFIVQVMFFLCVICCQDNLNSYGCIWIKFYKEVGNGQRHNWLFSFWCQSPYRSRRFGNYFSPFRGQISPPIVLTHVFALLQYWYVCVGIFSQSKRWQCFLVHNLYYFSWVYHWLFANLSSSQLFTYRGFCPIQMREVRALALSLSWQPAGLLGSLTNTLNLPLSTCGRCRKACGACILCRHTWPTLLRLLC